LIVVERRLAYLQLAIEAGSDPIAGSLRTPGEEPRDFNGWIELAEEIERARTARLAAPTNGAESHPH
jgi:hypothetical protein